MCKEMPVIPVNRVVDPKRIIGTKWRAEEEERHKGSLTKKLYKCRWLVFCPQLLSLVPQWLPQPGGSRQTIW
jgi:hypothetical protein